jgi:hypothetical protein
VSVAPGAFNAGPAADVSREARPGREDRAALRADDLLYAALRGWPEDRRGNSITLDLAGAGAEDTRLIV